jgi:CHAT domain-containing protein
MFRLPAGARELAEDVRWVIGGYGESATLRATAGRRRRLAEKLLGPVPAEIWQGVERLLVIPDGVLHELPFDLLPFGEDGELLLDRVAIATAPSATLAALLARRPSPPTESARVLVLGDPAPSPKLRLAGARAEAEAVGACFGDRAPPLLAEEATKAAFSRSAPEADIIHLATHGAVDQLQPLRSGLLFRDGLLRTYEIPRVRLAASLVVCSACESGLGRTFSGEGLLGLSRALLGAGARCVVGSLWKVDDQATRALMVDFYDRLLAGKPVAEALREAKLAIRAEHPDPFYWSAFVPTGSAF